MTAKTNRKPANTKPAGKTPPAPVVTNAGAMSQITSALTGNTKPVNTKPAGKPACKPAQTKEERAAERAKRYPSAAAKEAEKTKPGKTSRAAGAKPAGEKTAKITVEIVKRSLAKNAPVHVLSVQARPTSGARLAAHTHAALMILGMLDPSCPVVPLAAVRTIMGDRAIAYHTKEVNFETVQDHGVRLTPAGRSKFLGRTIDGKLANAFVDMLLDGKVDEATLQVKKGEVYQAKF